MSCEYIVAANSPYYSVRAGTSLSKPTLRHLNRDNAFLEQQLLWQPSVDVSTTYSRTFTDYPFLDQQTAQIWSNLGYFGFMVENKWILLLLYKDVTEESHGKETESENHQ